MFTGIAIISIKLILKKKSKNIHENAVCCGDKIICEFVLVATFHVS